MQHKQLKSVEQQKSIREKLGISQDEIIITSTGKITKEKGYAVLCEAIKKLKTQKKVTFIIAGDGEFLQEMKQEIEENNLTSKVKFLGYRKDITRILEETNIFVIATLHETLCNSLIEAAQQGLPLVATNVGGIPEIIENGVNGYLTKCNDSDSIVEALERLINGEELRKTFGNNAKKHIQDKFSHQKIISKIDQMYKRVLENDRR